MDEQNAQEKKSVLGANDEFLKIVSEMQRREATAGAVYKFLARRAEGGGSETLTRIAEEKAANAQLLAKYTGKDGRAPRLCVFCWRLVSYVFGSSFVISRLEAGEAEVRSQFSEAPDRILEVPTICAAQEEHRVKLREIIDHEGLRSIGAIATCLYSAILVMIGALACFTAAFSNLSQISIAALCAAVSAVSAGAVTGYFSQKAAAPRHPMRAAVIAAVLCALAAVLLVMPFFTIRGAWGALFSSAVVAVLMLAVVAFFTAVVRQETFFAVFVEMLVMTLGDAVVATIVVCGLKVWLKLNA